MPAGKRKFDENLQKEVETHRDLLRITVPVQQAGQQFRLAVDYQGCADKGLCYPPAQMRAEVSLAGIRRRRQRARAAGRGREPPEPRRRGAAHLRAAPAASRRRCARAASGSVWPVLLAGIGLSLTPCVLPMVPILSSIIVGHGDAATRGARVRAVRSATRWAWRWSTPRSAWPPACAGEGLAATLQNPWVLGTFALLLVRCRCRCSACTSCSCRRRHRPPRAASQRLPGGRFAACSRWAACRR
jgi:thiol:disulfide interchange protein DsbD